MKNYLCHKYDNEYNLIEATAVLFSKFKSDFKYEYVKLCDLKELIIYDVTMFNVEENETRSVILDNKYILVLPDSYIDALPIESIFFYNTNPQIKYKLFYNQSNIYWIG